MIFKFLISSAAAEAVTDTASSLSSMSGLPIFTKGLIVTGLGLLCVFLVLFLFYVTIKLMQRIKSKKDD